ncbi:DNA replication/repair protein RecF [Egicoccus halophilus]|uniref:DNA replication and repair protein RecF n=1 Tax=Egicoccus halophilus TaxID=1670830 RepID=A0A8J3ABF5_9ACTN|nr:DNA replication/repair protein RecF [Egicoccus halophilus]GGI03102.1 DNA replication and repair protein RecF [Egicoccus halophilus]
MRLSRLELQDVRSYERVTLSLSPGVTVLVGPNAQGKTNLLEAVHRAATGNSHRVAGDGPLVRAGADIGVIRLEALTDEGRRRTLELELGSSRRTRTRVDGHDVRRAADALGVLRVVLFAPEDVAVVRGDPAERRRFLDELLAQRRPAFAAARSEYERALRQRNQLLKQLRSLPSTARESAASTLAVWTDQLVTHGTAVVAARLAAVRTLARPVDAFYRDLADRPEPIGLAYRCSAGPIESAPDEVVPDPAPIAAAMRDSLAELAGDELARGVSLVGPHRDDLELTIGSLPARGYSSHGEAWSLALALKLATFEVLADVGDRPVVLLDDVFAELDTTRRKRLAAACERFDQVLVTAAVEEDVPLQGAKVDVRLEDGRSSALPRPPEGR